MNTRHLLAATFAAAIAATMAACAGNTPGTPGATASPGGKASPAAPQAPQMSATVTIRDFKFVPANVTIKKGGTVTWVNEDTAKHDAAPKGNTGFTQTKLLSKGESSEPKTFAAAGTFDYICSVHPTMTAKVTVVE